jgi:hypothetical protein
MRMPANCGDVSVFVDGCAVEVFCGGAVMTAMAFPIGSEDGVLLCNGSDGLLRAEWWTVK